MIRLRVVPIVEGHGEYRAIRILLQRIWHELLGGDHLEVLRPIRWPKTKLIKTNELQRAVRLAVLKLSTTPVAEEKKLILVVLDADEDPACELGPTLLRAARESSSAVPVSLVLAIVEYETWFVAAAESLGKYLQLASDETIPEEPEKIRAGKRWVLQHRGGNYSETLDQPTMTAAMDLRLCRKRSASFDKLCRELEKQLQ